MASWELAKRWRSCCPGKGIQRRDSHPRSEVFSTLGQPSSHARCQTCLGPGPLKRAVGCSFLRVRSTMPVSACGSSSASVLVMPYVLINPQYLHPCEAGGVIRCGLQAGLDVGPHGIPRGS